MNVNLRSLVRALARKGLLVGDVHPEGTVPVVCDSRLLPEAGPVLYVARTGRTFDGNLLAPRLLAQGSWVLGSGALEHPRYIRVTSTEHALTAAMELVGASVGVPTIAVTGTNGKTSVTYFAFQLLRLLGEPACQAGSLGIQLGQKLVPGTHPTMNDLPTFVRVLQEAQSQGLGPLVFEATSEGLAEGRLGTWQVDIALWTNLSPDHLDVHGTMENYRKAKELLFAEHLRTSGQAIFFSGDPLWETLAASSPGAQSTYGPGAAPSSRPHLEREGTLWRWQGQQARVATSLWGEFELDNLTGAAAICLARGHGLAPIAACVPQVTRPPGRLQELGGGGLPRVVVDYAHTPDALAQVLGAARKQCRGRLWVVFGCGGNRDPSKRPLMGRIANELADRVLVTSDNPRGEDPAAIARDIAEGTLSVVLDRKEAIRRALMEADPLDLVVVAGKGAETTQWTREGPVGFSDADVILEILAIRQKETYPCCIGHQSN